MILRTLNLQSQLGMPSWSSSDASIVTITNVAHFSTILHHLKLPKTNSPLRRLFLDIAITCFVHRRSFQHANVVLFLYSWIGFVIFQWLFRCRILYIYSRLVRCNVSTDHKTCRLIACEVWRRNWKSPLNRRKGDLHPQKKQNHGLPVFSTDGRMHHHVNGSYSNTARREHFNDAQYTDIQASSWHVMSWVVSSNKILKMLLTFRHY